MDLNSSVNLFEQLAKERPEPVNILHGTDWWTDCDDVAALRLLLRAHKAGVIRLLGVGINSVMPESAASVSAFCACDGVEVPIGVVRGAERDAGRCRYQKLLASYPRAVSSNEECPEAYKLYRARLAALDGRADITEVGFEEILMQLLKSPPDEFSPLTGEELVKRKVNRIWLMAGRWDVDPGVEYNLCAYPVCSEAGAYICEHCPVPVTFLGWEVGADVICGGAAAPDDPMKKAFEANGFPEGRSSWDPMTVLAAVIGDPAAAGYVTVRGRAHVNSRTGENTFTPDPTGPHEFLVRQKDVSWYAGMLDSLIC